MAYYDVPYDEPVELPEDNGDRTVGCCILPAAIVTLLGIGTLTGVALKNYDPRGDVESERIQVREVIPDITNSTSRPYFLQKDF